MSKWKQIFLASTAACVVASAAMLTTVTTGASAASTTPSAVAIGTVYQANLPCCQNVVLPAWPASSAPILTTGVVPRGSYSVVGNAFIVIGPSDVADNCWLSTTNSSDTVSGEGGAVGNGAAESGTGGGGVYANAVLNYTVIVNSANDHMILNCVSKHYGEGTYAASATLIATKVPTIISS